MRSESNENVETECTDDVCNRTRIRANSEIVS